MALQLEFSGSHEIAATRTRVWERLMDPNFVTQSMPGVESVRTVGPEHFQIGATLGMGFMKLSVTIDIRLSDLVSPERGTLRATGSAAGSTVDVVSNIQLTERDSNATHLTWAATTDIDGSLAGLGTGLVEGAARKVTTDFWADFARRVEQAA